MKKKSKRFLFRALLSVILLAGVWVIFNIQKNQTADQWTVTQYGDPCGSQSMFYTIQSDTDELIVVDGGLKTEEEDVKVIIKNLGGRVDDWIITHPHADHIGAFNEIYEDPDGIKIENIYTIDMDYEKYQKKAKEWDEFNVYEQFLDITKSADNITYLEQGDELELEGLHMTVLNAYGDYVDPMTEDLANDGSLMFKLEGDEESMLFCADVGVGMSNLILEKYGSILKSDYLQVGHHGYGGLSDEFYRKVSPEAAFFDAPDWLMNNISPSTGEPAAYDNPENVKLLEGMGASIHSFATAPNSIVLD